MKKVLPVIVLGVLLFGMAGGVLATAGDPCCADGDCDTGETCENAGSPCIYAPPVTMNTGTCSAAGGGGGIITDPQDVIDLIERVTTWVFTIVMALAILFIVLAAFFYITAAGNPETIGKGKTMLIYALVGIAVAVLARGLPLLIQAILEG